MSSRITNRLPDANRRSGANVLPLLLAGAVILVIGISTPKRKESPPPPATVVSTRNDSEKPRASCTTAPQSSGAGGVIETAEEIVDRRLKQFSRQQRNLAHKLARQANVQVLPDVERLFDALDAGDFAEAQRLYRSLRDGDHNDPLAKYWRAVVEAFGAAEQAQLWPAQQFLDYGNGILNSLPPGSVYVGGTDPGCFICTMLNATTDGEQHITFTQNGLADGTYLEYLRATIEGSLNIPTDEDLKAAYARYSQDAAQRLAHDQQFPGEPKQLKPGEDITLTDGKVNASGQTVVMAINSLVMQDILKGNPNLAFAMEESFPMASTYAGSTPLGPVVALNTGSDAQNAITPEAANAVVNFWQEKALALSATPDAANSSATMLSYAHDAAAQGNLLANNNFPGQAEQAYQTALAMSPGCWDAAQGLALVLAGQGRIPAANQALDDFVQNNPTQAQKISEFRAFYLNNKR